MECCTLKYDLSESYGELNLHNMTNMNLYRYIFADQIVISVPPVNTQVKVNQTAFLRCQASYSPVQDVIYTWLFNDEIIDMNNLFYKQVHVQSKLLRKGFFLRWG
jgi:hypothetical protein